ncbi:MAG: hypothetical protein JWM41_1393 [Gemmatimonadetes bacterium]|nr:hypothetical protein [Gemmatimonadota bacterium]
MPDPRSFADSEGMQWEVREIHSQLLSEQLGRLLGNEERRRGGWLVFEAADGEKRRLSPFPPDWHTVTPFELERWCMRAIRVPPAPARRKED